MNRAIKGLTEQMDAKLAEMKEIMGCETRSLEQAEIDKIEELKEEIRVITENINKLKEAEGMIDMKETREIKVVDTKETEETRAMEEVRALEQDFLDYVIGKKQLHETRSMNKSNTGVVIPTTIAQQIVQEILVQSPAVANCRHFNMTGNLTFVVEDLTTGKITASYLEEDQDITPSDAKFKSVTLGGHVIGAETIISKSLMLNSQFDLKSYIITAIAKAFVTLLESEIFEGTTKIKGVATIADDRKVKLVKDTAITSDHIIDLECKIPTALRSGAAFYMHPDMFRNIRKLKYTDDTYMVQKDFKDGVSMTLCGRPVYESEFVPASKIYFCDMSGMYMKDAQNLQTQVLVERYAERNAQAVIGICEMDAKPVELQKLACLEIAQA